MIHIYDITNSVFKSKTYILSCEGEDKAWLVDIGDVDPVLAYLAEKKLSVAGVFLTHGHFDHMYGLPALIDRAPGAMVYATAYTQEAIASEKLNLSKYSGMPIVRYQGDNVVVVKDGDEMELFHGEAPMTFLETPGHNPGCLTMVVSDNVFTGDAFIPGIGANTTVPKADKALAQKSLERILKLRAGKRVFPGHVV